MDIVAKLVKSNIKFHRRNREQTSKYHDTAQARHVPCNRSNDIISKISKQNISLHIYVFSRKKTVVNLPIHDKFHSPIFSW